MTRTLTIRRAGPAMTIQDQGRIGYLDAGISRGGAADRLALAEGAALLGQDAALPAIEMMGMGGEFEVSEDTRIALAGAPMRAQIDGTKLTWNASHLLPAGAKLTIGPALQGTYGYLHLGGGIHEEVRLGSQSAHLSAGIGAVLADGQSIAIGPDSKTQNGDYLPQDDRFDGGEVRVVKSFQSALFADAVLARFQAKPMFKDARANRMGAKLNVEAAGFEATDGKNIVSEAIVPGDIQITGDGTPFVLLSECQTVGGYPRIGTVLPCDLPRVVQAPAGARLQFRFIDLEEAVAVERQAENDRAALARQVKPLIRDPRTMSDLLSYNLISGMIAGTEFDQ